MPTWAEMHEEIEAAYTAGRRDAEFEMELRGEALKTARYWSIYEALGKQVAPSALRPPPAHLALPARDMR